MEPWGEEDWPWGRGVCHGEPCVEAGEPELCCEEESRSEVRACFVEDEGYPPGWA